MGKLMGIYSHNPEAQKRAIQLLPTMNNAMISREVDLSREYIGQLRIKHGIPSPLKRKQCSVAWNEDKLATLCKLDFTKHTRKEITELLNVEYSTLMIKCKELGIDISLCKGVKRGKRPMHDNGLLLMLYKKYNGNISKIAVVCFETDNYKTLNSATASISRAYKKLGLYGQGLHEGNGGRAIKRMKQTAE